MNLLSESIKVILKNQAKAGSFIACPNFDTYRYSWIRDGSFIAYSLDVGGEYESAEKFFAWVNEAIKNCEPKIEAIRKALQAGDKIQKDCMLNARVYPGWS